METSRQRLGLFALSSNGATVVGTCLSERNGHSAEEGLRHTGILQCLFLFL